MTHEVYGHIIEIWEPRYKDKTALIGRHHVMEGINYITFTKAPHLKDKVFQADSTMIQSCRLQANGRGEVYCVPMSKLKLVGYLTDTKAPEVQVTNPIVASYLERQGFTILESAGENSAIYVQGKRNNILVTVQPDMVYFDKITKTGRTFDFQEMDYTLSWKTLKDISLDEIPEEAETLREAEDVIAEDAQQEPLNPLLI